MYPLSPEYMFVVLASVRAEVEADRLASRATPTRPHQSRSRRRRASQRQVAPPAAREATANLAAERSR